MKISSTQEFNAIISTFCERLKDHDHAVKTSRAKELFALSLGYKSANGLIASIPVEVTFADEHIDEMRSLLKVRHDINVDVTRLIELVEDSRKSYLNQWSSDRDCYPSELKANEIYWYLTKDGWIPWSLMDFSSMKVELNIYKVVHAHSMSWFGDDASVGFADQIWTATHSTREFKRDAYKLEDKYGSMPDNEILYPKAVS